MLKIIYQFLLNSDTCNFLLSDTAEIPSEPIGLPVIFLSAMQITQEKKVLKKGISQERKY